MKCEIKVKGNFFLFIYIYIVLQDFQDFVDLDVSV